MSRVATLSPDLLAQMYSQEADTDVILLLTITGPGIDDPIRVCDGWIQRLSETAEDVVYGVISRWHQFAYIPMELTLPSDLDGESPRCRLIVHDAMRVITPVIRQVTQTLTAVIEVVSRDSPGTVEIEFPQFSMASISYSADQISADLTLESDTQEPFPAGLFTPVGFPGLF